MNFPSCLRLGQLCLALLLHHQVDAHTTAVCSATSKNQPGLVSIFVGTYHGIKEPAQGTGWLESPSGIKVAYPLDASAYPIFMNLYEWNMDSFGKAFRGHTMDNNCGASAPWAPTSHLTDAQCSALSDGGLTGRNQIRSRGLRSNSIGEKMPRDLKFGTQRLVDDDSVIQCYATDPCKNGNPSDPQAWGRVLASSEEPRKSQILHKDDGLSVLPVLAGQYTVVATFCPPKPFISGMSEARYPVYTARSVAKTNTRKIQ
jgi:hypothetical protein